MLRVLAGAALGYLAAKYIKDKKSKPTVDLHSDKKYDLITYFQDVVSAIRAAEDPNASRVTLEELSGMIKEHLDEEQTSEGKIVIFIKDDEDDDSEPNDAAQNNYPNTGWSKLSNPAPCEKVKKECTGCKECKEKGKEDRTVIKITDGDDKVVEGDDLFKESNTRLYKHMKDKGLLDKDKVIPFLMKHFEDKKKAEKEHNASRKCEHMAKYIRDSIDHAARKENVSWRDELKNIQDYINHNLI